MVSVIIPTLNEQIWLPRCLDALLPQTREADAEVIVVDGGSRDRTRAIAAEREGVRLVEARRGRGRQMNAGARASGGSLLVFSPADTLLPPGAMRLLAEIDRAGEPGAGGFRQRFDSRHPLLRVVSRLTTLRAVLTGVYYGDQVPFVRRELFDELHGFREDFDMEDVEFGTRLRRRTRTKLLPLEATTSARRFEHSGPLRATVTAAGILAYWIVFRRAPGSATFFAPVR